MIIDDRPAEKTTEEKEPRIHPYEDDLGGYNPDEKLSKWKCGSIFSAEGERLYRLVRDVKPKTVLTVGRWEGCGDSHIALALKHNGFGRCYSLDILESTGGGIPVELRKYITFINANALTYEWPKRIGPIDICFEDGAHDPGFTESIIKRFPCRVFVSHDYHHPSCKCVHDEFNAAFGNPDEDFFVPPSDCGLAIKFLDKSLMFACGKSTSPLK
jgi:hypothetical protein